MNDEEKKVKHLEFIQGVITRMNQNSFQLKEWMITIVSALLALYASSSNVIYIFVALLPILIFWFLDAYYLQQERKFRGVYNDVVNDKGNVDSFSMPINKYEGGDYSYWNVFASKTEMGLYLSLSLILLIGGLVLMLKDCICNCNCTCCYGA